MLESARRVAEKKDWIKGAAGDWEIVIGMEVHAQVTAKSKLFSGASAEFGAAPNDHVSLVDAAMPGMLPVINAYCVEQAVRTGLGLKAQINKHSVFDRKNYFYPDLPQGYQISQYKQPIVGEGSVHIDADGRAIEVGIERLHLEQDAGKSLHDQHPSMSFVDLNRSGCALMEIVSRPDLRSAEEAKAYVTKLRQIMRYLGTCDGNMEQGSLRADINVSVRRPGAEFGTRCEIKNVNSIRFMGQAIDYEARRQIGILEDGGRIDQETRLFDARKGETRSMRSKEEAHDYRYFPDPDLLPLELDDAWIAAIKMSLPELPDEKKARLMKDYNLTSYLASVAVAEPEIAERIEEELEEAKYKEAQANWFMNEYMAHLKKYDIGPYESSVTASANVTIVTNVVENKISNLNAKKVLEIIEETKKLPEEIIEERGFWQENDADAIEKAVDDIVAANPGKVAQAKAKPSMLGWFVGQVMKATGGKVNPETVNRMLREKLEIN
ncbi:MAG: Asp-tRNA(Asn)/Glu-tRNA(Gln) amidotransferase subunit GatB [Hyphomicrobiales bacterium]